MKIVIAGAGEVGIHIARLLSNESQSTTLIDENGEHLDYASTHLDIRVVKGDATSISVLKEAEVQDSDMVIAVTSSQEANLLLCLISKQLGCKRTIARVSNHEYVNSINKRSNNGVDFATFGIDEIISPEELAVSEIKMLLNRYALSDVFEFEKGALVMMGVLLDKKSPLVSNSVKEFSSKYTKQPFTCIAILRKGTQYTVIPRGNTTFEEGDLVYLIVPKDRCEEIYMMLRKDKQGIKNVLILGGSRIGRKASKDLGMGKFSVKLIEKEKKKAQHLAERLREVLVINGDGSSLELLKEEGISDADAFIAVTGNSETNIMSCLMAKQKGVKKTIALVENVDYFQLSNAIGIDTLINKKILAADSIFRHVRKGHVLALTSLSNTDAEILEFEVKNGSLINGKKVKDFDMPRSAVIGGVVREKRGLVPSGDFEIKEGDKVVTCCLPEAISKMESLFH
ncbi:trk system potassium uptake protein TrkA [Elysia marginata]|uniref:Trk system potassium uptake protein TrkA n=1 Tax=Elysia marginata TaxID=1093978 RepID=A0AAV4FYA0_9GAST|nr:trk system potassium uptake protein TrkA [Elysia marginata]